MKLFPTNSLTLEKFKKRARSLIWKITPPESHLEHLLRKIANKYIFQKGDVKQSIIGAANSYHEWILSQEKNRVTTDLKILSYQPLVTFIMPISASQEEVAYQTILSLQQQSYKNWQLILNDLEKKQFELLWERVNKDRQITCTNLLEHRYFDLISIASGDYVVLIRPGDTFSNNFLELGIQTINQYTDVKIIYSDNDQISRSGNREFPFFKPHIFSPELLLSVNYLSRALIKKDLVLSIGAEYPNVIGLEAEEWRLILAFTKKKLSIQHIAAVLVHIYLDPNPDDEVQVSEILHDHLRQLGLANPSAIKTSKGWRVIWQTKIPLISIIIPNKNKYPVLKRCLDSIFSKECKVNYELVIVDNDSNDNFLLNYYQELSQNNNVKIIPYNETFNFSHANNLGAQAASGDLLLFLNNDIEIIHADWLEELARWALLPETGIVGTKLLYPTRQIQHSGIIIGLQGFVGHLYLNAPEDYSGLAGSSNWYRNFSAVTGACQMIRRSVLTELGGYDEGYQLVFSDIALCLKALEKNYRVIYTPFAELLHYEGQSRGKIDPLDDLSRGFKQIGDLLVQDDPYFSPCLTYTNIPNCQLNIEERKERAARMRQKLWAVERWNNKKK